MKINKMTASFGKLENESIAFHDGLNVVCAPNESGKSTWCAFIKSMLYGVDSAERAKIGYPPDKMRHHHNAPHKDQERAYARLFGCVYRQ